MDTEVAKPDKPQPSKAKRPEDMTDSEKANLAWSLSPEERKAVGSAVVKRVKNDAQSRSERMKRLDQLQKMYALIAEKKAWPWHNCANVKTPSLTGPNLQIQARLIDMVWPSTGKVFSVVPATAADEVPARQGELFANSYVRHKMAYMAQGLDDTMHQLTLYGSAFRRTYYDALAGQIRSDWIPMEDFVVAAKCRSQDPSMSDVPRYTMVHHMSMMDIRAYGREGIYVDTQMVKGGQEDDEDKSGFRETAEKIDGQSMEDDDEDLPRKVYEQHFRWMAPNKPKQHPAFDGKEHYVFAEVDKVTGTLLSLRLREEPDPEDQRRYDREKQRFDAYEAQIMAMASGQTAMTEPPVMGVPDMSAPPMPGAMDSTAPMDPMGQAPIAPMVDPLAAMPPELPEEVPPPKPVRKRQICFFTHYRCFPSEGFYGLGYGDLLLGLATAENTVINQWVDGQAVKNARPMFMSRQIRMTRGAVDIGPAAVNEVDGPVASIKDAITFLDPPGSDPGTVPLIKMLQEMRDLIAGNSDLMSGQAPGSNQTKAGMQILNEQAMAPITVLARRVKEAFRHELMKIWRCFGVFLEDEEVHDVIGEGGQPMPPMQVGKSLFSPTAHLVPTSDPRMKSQRKEDFQELLSFCMNSPAIMQNPPVMMAVTTRLTEMGLKLFTDGEQLLPLLNPPPPPPPQPKDQVEENAGFLNEQDSPVLPDDDDDDHINKSLEFQQRPEFQAMSPNGKMMQEKHFRAHLAQRMNKQRGMNGQGPFGGPGGFGPPAPPPQPGSGM